MTEIQLGSGSSSSASHRITRSSSTLNRRYVSRPSNLAIEEAAKSASTTSSDSSRPSRLVNLRVHSADLAQAISNDPTPSGAPVVPKVVELGTPITTQSSPTQPLDLSQVVPEEAPIEEIATPSIYATPSSYDNTTYTDSSYTESSMLPAVSDSTSMAQPLSMSEVDSQTLAMNIAADYATASLGASLDNLPAGTTVSGLGAAEVSDNSIDAIARAASEAIASIRVATDPDEVAEQVASLKNFAENIKASSAAPEMVELSDTIEKFVNIAMKSSKVQEEVEQKLSAKRAAATVKTTSAPKVTLKKSSTKAAPKPTATRKAPLISNARRATTAATPSARPTLRRNPKKITPKLGGTEEQALRKALHSVAALDDEPVAKPIKKHVSKKTSGKRFALAFFCATACVAAVVYLVGSNIPDISVKVAAMQTGIEATYPAYIPRDYSLSDISSEDGRITLSFKGPDGASFVLSEEKSSWDSTTLLRNYVEPTWQSNYVTTHEQGITVYMSGANAAWVNGGILYKIDNTGGTSLTKKQLRNIVTSL